jgi:exoribonuclease R
MDHRKPLEIDFARIRAELDVPDAFPPAVLADADAAAQRLPLGADARARRRSYNIVPFVTIDPESALDLDQAFYAQERDGGYIVLYAIADVGYFVDRGSAVETEAWTRGATVYSPDLQTPLYPPALGQGAASLLPGVERPCVLFTFELDERANARLLSVERATIVSRAKLAYDRVSRHLDAERDEPGTGEYAAADWAESLALLETIGRQLQLREVERDGVSLPIASQHVGRSAAALGGYHLAFRRTDDVEGWNAQISLMTGMQAARAMIRAGVGVLRVLDPPAPDRIAALRLTAAALGIPWSEEASYAEFIRSLDPTVPLHAAVIFHASGVMGAARYVAFEGSAPTGARHAAIGAYYAHVTAPLRRLADRYVLDLLVDLFEGSPPAGHATVLHLLPPLMQEAERLGRRLESAVVDQAEARLLAGREGELFDALVIRLRDDRVTVQITDPPVRAEIRRRDAGGDGHGASLGLGAQVSVRLDSVDTDEGHVSFALAGS